MTKKYACTNCGSGDVGAFWFNSKGETKINYIWYCKPCGMGGHMTKKEYMSYDVQYWKEKDKKAEL